jgi:hypothetical protein
VIALVVVLNKQPGLSFGKIATLLQQLYGLTVTRRGTRARGSSRRPAGAPHLRRAMCARARQSDGQPERNRTSSPR